MEKKAFLQWVEQGSLSVPIVLLQNYKRLGVSEEAIMTMLQLYSFIEKGNLFPTPGEISERMTITEQRCTEILRKCLQTGVLEIKEQQDSEFRHAEVYSLQPLWEKIMRLLEQDEIEKRNNLIRSNEKDVFSIYEREFGRPLSPIEYETLTIWIDQDQHKPDLIIAALKEAVLSGKMNFRYIDRILFEWTKNGIQTVEEARKYGEKFRRYQNQKKKYDAKDKTNPKESEQLPFFNWLEQ
jgi:DNA replication protein